jgi:hypothetical protein
MIFFLAFPIAGFFLAMLLAAAFTFTVTSAIPALRSRAITAPIAAFLLSPVIFFAAIVMWTSQHHMFITQPASGSAAFLIRFCTGLILLTAGCSFVAAVAVLACRIIVEIVPPMLARLFNLRPQLFLQAIILAGGSLSILVLLTSAACLCFIVRESIPSIVGIAVAALLAAALCLRAILHLTEPECYQPKPIPTRLRNLLIPQQ